MGDFLSCLSQLFLLHLASSSNFAYLLFAYKLISSGMIPRDFVKFFFAGVDNLLFENGWMEGWAQFTND